MLQPSWSFHGMRTTLIANGDVCRERRMRAQQHEMNRQERPPMRSVSGEMHPAPAARSDVP